MSIFEYWFERKNPGNVGGIYKNKKPIKPASILIVAFRLIISSLIVYGLFNITVLHNITIINTLIFIVVFLGYCILSYNYIPRPDTSNIGLLGGLIDHPFKYTDDMNRMLIAVLVLMYPGRFISTTIMQVIKLFKNSYHNH